jgi:hypothetical protein
MSDRTISLDAPPEATTTAPVDPAPASPAPLGPLAGFGALVRVELRRWTTWRSLVLLVASTAVIVLLWAINPAESGEAHTRFTLVLLPWSTLVAVVALAIGQGLVAGAVEDGSAGWVVSNPVERRSFVLARALAVVPLLAGLVAIPGAVGYVLLDSTAAEERTPLTWNTFDRAVRSGRSAFEETPAAGDYAVILGLVAVFAVFLAVVMVLLGTRIVSSTALFSLGILVMGVLIALGTTPLGQFVPGTAYTLIASPDRADDLSAGVALASGIGWCVVVMIVATRAFQRRPL